MQATNYSLPLNQWEKLFEMPVSNEFSTVRKVLNVAFHILTLALPLACYHLYHYAFKIKAKRQEKVTKVLVIQNFIRTRLAIDQLKSLSLSHKEKTDSTILIQSFIRKRLGQRHYDGLRQNKENSAIVIQSKIRTSLARQVYHEDLTTSLNYSLFEKVKAKLTENPLYLHQSEKLMTDVWRIYRPTDAAIEIRQPEGKISTIDEHLGNLKIIYKFCKKQNYLFIEAPRARKFDKFIIQESYPTPIYDVRHQMSLYLENQDKFTRAIEEFTELRCHFYFGTLENYDPYQRDIHIDYPNYSILALFFKNDIGKIGLRDLDYMRPVKYTEKEYNNLVFQLISLFPHHLSAITSVIQKFCPSIHKIEKEILEHQQVGIKKFDYLVGSHLRFLAKNKITIENPLKVIPLTKARMEAISLVLEEELLKENNCNTTWGDFLGENPTQTIEWFRYKFFPKLYESIIKMIEISLRSRLQILEEINNTQDLLKLRQIQFSGFPLEREFLELLKILHFSFDNARSSLLCHLQDVILKELCKGGEIAEYGPYHQGIENKFIFC